MYMASARNPNVYLVPPWTLSIHQDVHMAGQELSTFRTELFEQLRRFGEDPQIAATASMNVGKKIEIVTAQTAHKSLPPKTDMSEFSTSLLADMSKLVTKENTTYTPVSLRPYAKTIGRLTLVGLEIDPKSSPLREVLECFREIVARYSGDTAIIDAAAAPHVVLAGIDKKPGDSLRLAWDALSPKVPSLSAGEIVIAYADMATNPIGAGYRRQDH